MVFPPWVLIALCTGWNYKNVFQNGKGVRDTSSVKTEPEEELRYFFIFVI